MITTAYTYVCQQYGSNGPLIALTVNTVTKYGGELIARTVAADRLDISIDHVEVVQSAVEVAGLVSNPGEDFRERAALDKLARRYARRFRRMTAKQREMVMPAVLRAVCPGMPVVVMRDEPRGWLIIDEATTITEDQWRALDAYRCIARNGDVR